MLFYMPWIPRPIHSTTNTCRIKEGQEFPDTHQALLLPSLFPMSLIFYYNILVSFWSSATVFRPSGDIYTSTISNKVSPVLQPTHSRFAQRTFIELGFEFRRCSWF